MRKRARSHQLMLFPPTPQKHALGPEKWKTYSRVLLLRTRGRRVWRQGAAHHLVDGKILSTREMMALADAAAH